MPGATLELNKPLWTPIEKCLPDNMEDVLVMVEGIDQPRMAAWWLFQKENRIVWHQTTDCVTVNGDACLDHEELKVTHWMALPKGP